MADVRGKLGDESEVPRLARAIIRCGSHGNRQWFVVGVDDEFSALQQVPEVADHQIHGQQLPVESAVVKLCTSKSPREKPD